MRRLTLLLYACPAFVIALPTIPVYVALPTLYGVELGLGLAKTGLILLCGRLFDTVSDPLIGYLSDRFPLGSHRRKPWIAGGAIVAGLGLAMILNPLPGAGISYLLVWSIVLYAGWTMVAVPYMAWGAELSDGYEERTRVTAWREGIGLLGLVGAGALTAAATAVGWSEKESIGFLAWVAIALGAIAFPVLLMGVPEASPRAHEKRIGVFPERLFGLRSLLDNGPFLRLIAAWFLNGLANGIPAALFFLYLEYALGAGETQRPIFILIYFVSAVAAIPVWKFVSTGGGKHRAWCFAMLIACVAFATVPWIPEGAFGAFMVVCIVTGAALGADLVLPPSMQADVVDFQTWRSGQVSTGLLFALWGMGTKLALAASVGIALPVVDVAGFDPTAPTASGILALSVIYALVPVVIKLSAILLVWHFPLTHRKHVVIGRALDRRQKI